MKFRLTDTTNRSRGATWALIAAALGAALWFVLTRDTPRTAVAASGSVDVSPGSVDVSPGSIAEFTAFAVENNAEQETIEHAYTADGIRKLAAAVEQVVDIGSTEAQHRDVPTAMRAQADELQRDPRSTRHAHVARAAFMQAAEVMTAIQTQRHPHLDRAATELRDAALAVRPDRLLLTQAQAVERFFERASDLLKALAETQTASGRP